MKIEEIKCRKYQTKYNDNGVMRSSENKKYDVRDSYMPSDIAVQYL